MTFRRAYGVLFGTAYSGPHLWVGDFRKQLAACVLVNRYVVDSGRHKEKTYDEEANLACLLPAWVSQASAHQRRGRAGRVRDGQCYHLFPHRQLESMHE